MQQYGPKSGESLGFGVALMSPNPLQSNVFEGLWNLALVTPGVSGFGGTKITACPTMQPGLPASSKQSRDAILPNIKRLIFAIVAGSVVLAPLSAEAGVFGDAIGLLGLKSDPAPAVAQGADTPAAILPDQAPATDQPAIGPNILSRDHLFSARAAELTDLNMPALPSVAVAELPAPSVETPLHKLFCVEYARARSGLAVFGDAKFWWSRAKNLYARMASPVEEAVMVFSGSKRLARGHVAVVTHIVSAREIRVDQANWENHGEIDHATPVLDVSKKNDWSKVRVWDIRSQSFGAHVYAISGFIAKGLTQQASNN